MTALDRACNDLGDGGVCTWCDELHTATVVMPCPKCLYPPDACRCNVIGIGSGRGFWSYIYRIGHRPPTEGPE